MNRKVRIILAFVIAIGMLLFSYWVTNQHYAISGETALMRKLELVKGWFKPHINPMADSVLLINVSYDTVLEGAYDNYNLPVGLEQITDHQKLFQLLKELKRKNDYKIGTHGFRHNTGSKNGKFNRKARKGSTLSKSDQKRFKNVLN